MTGALSVVADSSELPVLASPLGANGYPTKLVSAVESPLEANAGLFTFAGHRVLLVTVDLLFIGPTLMEAARAVARRNDPKIEVWISASHTHRAPAVDLNKPGLGVVSAEALAAIVSAVCAMIEGLMASDKPGREVHPVFSCADMDGLSVHRRSRGRIRLTKQGLRLGGVVMAPNTDVTVQREAVRVDWVDAAGETQLVMWHWACHPTAFPEALSFSADYVGVVRDRLRGQLGDVPVLFFQGFAGDIRPPATRTWRSNPFRRLLLGPGFRRFSVDEYLDWSQECARRVAEAIPTEMPALSGVTRFLSERATVDAGQYVNGGHTKTVTYQKVALGPISLFGVSAEPSNGHVPEGTDPTRHWYCGYLENVYGYLPTEEQYREGGYEVDGFCSAFGCEGLELDGIRRFSALMAECTEPDVYT